MQLWWNNNYGLLYQGFWRIAYHKLHLKFCKFDVLVSLIFFLTKYETCVEATRSACLSLFFVSSFPVLVIFLSYKSQTILVLVPAVKEEVYIWGKSIIDGLFNLLPPPSQNFDCPKMLTPSKYFDLSRILTPQNFWPPYSFYHTKFYPSKWSLSQQIYPLEFWPHKNCQPLQNLTLKIMTSLKFWHTYIQGSLRRPVAPTPADEVKKCRGNSSSSTLNIWRVLESSAPLRGASF